MLVEAKTWPNSAEKLKIGEISADSPLTVNIQFDDIDAFESIELVLIGKDDYLQYSRKLPVSKEISLQLSPEEEEIARSIQVSLYVLNAHMKNGGKRLLSKGRVNWQTGIEK